MPSTEAITTSAVRTDSGLSGQDSHEDSNSCQPCVMSGPSLVVGLPDLDHSDSIVKHEDEHCSSTTNHQNPTLEACSKRSSPSISVTPDPAYLKRQEAQSSMEHANADIDEHDREMMAAINQFNESMAASVVVTAPTSEEYLEVTQKEGTKGRLHGAQKRQLVCNDRSEPLSTSPDRALDRGTHPQLATAPKKAQNYDFQTAVHPPAKRPKRGRMLNESLSTSKSSKYLGVSDLMQNDIVANAAANRGKEGPQVFSATSRSGVRKELLAAASEEKMALSRKQARNLEDACKQFPSRGEGSIRSDGQGGWRLQGMRTSLFSYQLLCAGWARGREMGDDEPKGGMLCDAMGLGKTVEIITTFATEPAKAETGDTTTLIVCPLSLCSQWLSEIEKHCAPSNTPRAIVYRTGHPYIGSDHIGFIRRYPIVITTYHDLMVQYPESKQLEACTTTQGLERWQKHYEANKGALLQMTFHRVILDEAQAIKNHASRTSKGCRALQAKHRWVVSGTPLSNGIDELYPYFDFLKINEARSFAEFKRRYGKRDEVCAARLDEVLRSIMIRRTHRDEMFGRPILQLPGLDLETVKLEFSPLERAFYNLVSNYYVGKINSWSIRDLLTQKRRSIFAMLTRLRQICAHLLLVMSNLHSSFLIDEGASILAQVRSQMGTDAGKDDSTTAILEQVLEESLRKAPSHSATNQADGSRSTEPGPEGIAFHGVLRRLREDGEMATFHELFRCAVCFETPVRPRLVLPCRHVYCEKCRCQCKGPIIGRDILPTNWSDNKVKGSRRKSDDRGGGSQEPRWVTNLHAVLLSTKISKTVELISEWLSCHAGSKIIVFSLWRLTLECLARVCESRGWRYCTLNGGMDSASRAQSLREFSDGNSGKQVLLATMQTGGVGLNLTAARFVVILDPWWNEAAEDQAYCRQ